MPPRPHLLDDVGVRLGDLALHPQRVAEVELAQVGAPQEVLGQRGGVAQTLQGEGGGSDNHVFIYYSIFKSLIIYRYLFMNFYDVLFCIIESYCIIFFRIKK